MLGNFIQEEYGSQFTGLSALSSFHSHSHTPHNLVGKRDESETVNVNSKQSRLENLDMEMKVSEVKGRGRSDQQPCLNR